MTHADSFLDYGKLEELEQQGFISVRQHPADDSLLIYNYTARCAYEDAWTTETLSCRGLILDSHGYVVSRPFRKFFNLSQHEPEGSPYPRLPLGSPFLAYEKLDGSLGISYSIDGKTMIATRGSFDSDQARWANTWWSRNGEAIPNGQTYLFEIIYPQNRIVVDYGQRSELVLLAIIDNATGADLPLPGDWTGSVARRYDAESVGSLLESTTERENFEGYVLLFPSTGQRVKVKLDEYVRLHRVLTGCSTKTIWEILSNGGNLDAVLDRVPDEFYAWVRAQEGELRGKFKEVESDCLLTMLNPIVKFPSRREVAEYFKQHDHPHVLFRMLDGKDYASQIWKMLKPEFSRPFVVDEP